MNWEVVEEGGKGVDWERLCEGLELGGRGELEEVVEKVQEELVKLVELGRKYRKWKMGRKKWWNEEVEKKHMEVRGVEKEWERGNRLGGWEKVVQKRKEWKDLVKEVKGQYWGKYLEGMDMNKSYRWIKMNRDFVVDLRRIKGMDGEWYERDEEKEREIVRGLEKRKERC